MSKKMSRIRSSKPWKLIQTAMVRQYEVNLFVRVAFFGICLWGYLFHRDEMFALMTQPIRMGITPIHVLWLIFMVMMINHLIPKEKFTMALRKSYKEQYVPVEGYSELELLQFVQEQNQKAWIVMLVWLCFNAIFGILYLFKIIDTIDLLMLTVFYFLCDYICILFFCPFQTKIMKNKCCVNCRIYDWGHIMMFTPMLFIQNFFSWSLFFTSIVVLIHWEITYAKHPERFWSGSNQTLQCANCKDKTCQMKRRLVSIVNKNINKET